ncbi:MlaA family lipoprotein, partial [Klebsiella pneumoniae]|uniref:MlaA family lipoprotein n=1 Tax=Klebsiella pneumoniae TaxID=573 RepID=UPI002730C3AB
ARFALLKPVRSQMSLVLMQTYWITDLPQRLYQGVASQFGSRTELVAENEKLKTENLLLQGRLKAGLDQGMRVAVNSTFGLAGLLDVASEAG